MPIAFKEVGVFGGLGTETLSNPTSLQFGPDGRLYVSEQNGTINAFTVSIEDGKYIATSQEVLKDAGGNEVVKNIQNHFDDGSESPLANRQVTGIAVAGTAEVPVLYISSSNPDIASNGEKFLDTNSGVVSRATWNSSTGAWDVVDLVRGLPRSEENHAVNGMLLSEDGNTLLLQVGGFTNNGGPSGFFSYTNEYALSGAILELDLVALDALPTLTDPQGGQGDTPRGYKYDLPTLDDPNRENAPDTLTDAQALAQGFTENSGGMDLAGPWGGNDGLNMAILPNDAPLRLYADGLRNAYDLARTSDGKIYTVDNGSNGSLGGAPSREGVGVDLDGDGITNEAIGTPNNSSYGEGEPLFLIEEGGFYQHANPVRSNQNMAWTVYDDSGNPDQSLTVNQVADISALVPAQLLLDGKMTQGFLIDPSKFAGLEGLDPNDPADRALIDARLFQSGQGVDRDTAASVAITTVGSSTNGIIAYDSNGQAFNGVLDGKLFVTQFNDNVTLLNINADGTALVPVLAEGPDGIFGTADDVVQDADGILPVANNQLGVALGNPLDVTVGPDGTLWVAEIGSNEITVLAPSDLILPGDTDGDDDGILNVNDPFMRDATNGTGVQILPGQVYLWDFDPNQDGNLPGPDGFGGGLTGVMINKTTDFEQFLQADYSGPGTENIINLDNAKFITAAGGGNTVLENVSAGDASGLANTGEFLFHTGVTLADNVGTATIKWSMFNPAGEIDGAFQQIGGYIGTGDQSNFLKLVAIEGPNGGDFQIVLEDDDQTVSSQLIETGGVFDTAQIPTQPPGKIFFELLIDVIAGTAVPKITYDTDSGQNTATGASIDLSGTAVLEAVRGDFTVQGQASGLAVGLYSSSVGQAIVDVTDTFGAAFDDIEITATEAQFAPDAVDDAVSAQVGQALNIPVAQLLANDSDPNPTDTLSVTGVSNGVNGTASLSNGVVTFTPATPEFEGTASFDYEISDGNGGTDTATVTVTVANEFILYRVNAGGNVAGAGAGTIAAIDGGPDWVNDATLINSAGPVTLSGVTNNTYTNEATDTQGEVEFIAGPNAADAAVVPWQVYVNERGDNNNNATKLTYDFDVTAGATYKVSLFYTENWVGIFDFVAGNGQSRQFDVAVEGSVPEEFSDINPLREATDAIDGTGAPLPTSFSNPAYLGMAFQRDYVYTAQDDVLTLTWDHGTQNPKINAIQISQVGGAVTPLKPVVGIVSGDQVVSEDDGTVQISILTNFTVPADETVDINFTIEPVGGTTPGAAGDYVYNSSSATFGGGVYTDTKSIAGSSSDLTIPIEILADDLPEGAEAFKVTILSVSPNATLGSNSEATVTIAANDAVTNPGDVLVRINAGGPEVAADDGGPAWEADQSAVTANGNGAVIGTPSQYLVDRGVAADDVTYGNNPPEGPGANATGAPDALFTTERFSTVENPNNIGYAFDLGDGDYIVNLYFDELFFAGAGERLFDVEIEGSLVLDDFDTFVAAGNTNNTVKQSFGVTVDDGTLNIEFLKGAVNNPHVAAIEIIDDSGGTGLPEISIAAPVPSNATETGDAGVTTLTFPVTFDEAPTEPVTVSYTVSIDGIETTGELVLGTTDGVIAVDVANDDAANGDESVTVTLDAITAGGTAAQLGVTSASASVIEDDVAAPAPGTVVLAINAGGGAIDGAAYGLGDVDFEADTGAGHPTVDYSAASQGNKINNNGSGQTFTGAALPDDVFTSERWGDDWSYDVDLPNGDYIVDLYFAETYQGVNANAPAVSIGARKFDVEVEGVEVLDDYDLFDDGNNVLGDDAGAPLVKIVKSFAATVTDGVLSVAFNSTAAEGGADNAKLSALVIRTPEASTTPVVSIGDAGAVLENGDVDATTLTFPVTFDVPPAGDVTVEYSVDLAGNVTTGSAVIPPAGGAISVDVPSDAVANGNETVTVTLTGIALGAADLGGQTSGSGTVTEDDAGYVPPADDLFGTAVEISNDGTTPSDGGELVIGSNVMSATQEGESDGANGVRDRDYFTVTIPTGAVLTGIFLDNFVNDNTTAPDGFMAIQLGGAIPVDPTTGSTDGLLGGIIYGAGNIGANLLDIMSQGGDPGAGTGVSFDPFEAALTGQVTVWLNQGAGPGTPTLNFVVEAQGLVAIGAAPTIAETGDDPAASDTLLFPLTGPAGANVTLEYSVDGAPQTAVEVTFDVNGEANLPVAVAQDDVDNADDVIVELTGVSSARFAIGAAARATGVVTEDDAALAPVGFGPNDDLDQDGTINSEDDNIDGDQFLNGDETFVYDATNVGTALVAGQTVTFEFDTASTPSENGLTGTPFENGLTGALLSPNKPAAEIDLNNAEVSGGSLNITATAGDHFNANNTQQNALVAGFTAAEGLRVETRFALPDFDDDPANGITAPQNFQAAGVVIGFDQNNLVKAVFGRGAAQFQLVQDNAGNLGPSDILKTPVYPTGVGLADVAEILLSLEVFIDASGDPAVAKARAFATFFDAGGAAIPGIENLEIGEITLEDQAQITNGNKGTTLASQVLNGDVLGAGVIQTGTGANQEFDVSYEYLKVTALGTPPANIAPTADAIIVDPVDENAALVSIDLLTDANAADGDGGTPAVDPASIVAVDQDANPVAFTLDGTSLSIDPADFAALNSGESATVTVSYDITDGQGGVTPNTATLTVNGVDDAPVPMVSISGTPSQVEAGDAGVTTLTFDLAYTGGTNETREVTYTVNGGGTQTATILFTDNAATLAVEVANDDLADGEDAVTVVLTGIGDNVTDMVDALATTAGGTVAEDDFAPVAVADAPVTPQDTPITFDPAANDTDADLDGGALTVVAIDDTATTGGTVVLNGDGTVTVTPETGSTADIVFGYTVADAAGNQDATGSATVAVSANTIVALSGAPVEVEAGDAGVTTLVFTLTGAANAAADLVYSVGGVAQAPVNVVFDATGAATLSVDVANDDLANGPDSVEVALVSTSTAGFAVDTTFATGTVSEDDAAPVAVGDSESVLQGQSITFDPAANDADADLDGAALTVTAIDPTPGVVLNANGTVTVTAAADAPLGDIVFGYTVADPAGNSAQGTATVTVEEFSAPTAVRIQAEDFTSSAGYAAQAQNAADGGEVIFLPSNGASGSATFALAGKGVLPGTYDVTIGYFDENDGQSTIGVTVDSVSLGSITLNDDAASGNAAQAASFRTKTFFGVEVGENGQLVLDATTDAGEYARIDYIEFTPVGAGPENTAPFAPFDLPAQSVDENTAFSFDAGALFADNEENDLTFTAVSDLPGGALPAGVTFDPATGIFAGTPGAVGVYQITVTANDGALDSAPEVFTLSVEGINEAPKLEQAIADQILSPGVAFSLDVAGAFSDPDLDTLSYATAGALPDGVSFADGVFSGAPSATATPGSYQVTVTATDPSGASVSDTFLLNVLGNDDRDTVRIEAESGALEPGGFFIEAGSRIRLLADDSGTATYDLSGVAPGDYIVKIGYYDENDGVSRIDVSIASEGGSAFDAGFDLDDDATSTNAANPASFRVKTLDGAVTLGAGGQLSLTGQSGGNGSDWEFVRVDYIELVPVGGAANFAPSETGGGVSDQTVQGLVAVDIDVSGGFADPEEDALTYAIVDGPAWLAINPATGVLSGIPDAGGVYPVVVSARDAANPDAPAISDFTITVDVPQNAAPTLDFPVGALSVAQDGFLEEAVTFSDPEGGAVTYSLGAGAPDWLSIDAFGTLSGQPGAGDVASGLQVEVIGTDAQGASASAIVDLTVTNVNDAPELGAALADQSAVVGQAFAFALPAGAFTDADAYLGDTLSYSAALADGSALPGWLSIDVATGALAGIPDSDADLAVVITASDGEASVSAPALAIEVTTFTVPMEPVAIEAEDFTGLGTATNFVVNNLAGASGSQIIRMPANVDGTITTDLSAYAGGSYKVAVTYIDETDGVSTGRVLVDGVVLGEWSFDGASGSQLVPGGATGTLAQPGNYRVIELDAPFVIADDSVLTLEVASEGGEFGRIDAITLVPAEIPEENQVPTIELANVIAGIAEDADTAAPIKVADIVVSDDGLGVNAIGLSGADAGLFTIVGTELFLAAGATLDAETQAQLSVAVTVDDTTVGATPDGSAPLTLAVTDVNEAPTAVTLTPVVTEIAENTSAATKVADIAVTDDALGVNTLALTGADAGLFEIVGTELFLKAGQTLDATANPTLDVAVTVNDASVGIEPVDAVSTPLSLPVTEAGGEIQDQIVLRINAFGPEVAATDGGPVWQADLKDDPGTAQNENSPYLDLVSTSAAQDRGDTFAGYSGNPALIPAGVPEAVLDSARSSDAPFSYTIPVADLAGNGMYRVNLYFAELFTGNQTAGDRIFDVAVEDVTEDALDNFDPSAPNGGGDLTVISYEVDVQDGFLNIGFAQDTIDGVDNPIVNAIEIVKIGAAAADNDGPTASIALTNPATATDALVVSVTLADATGIDATTLGAEDLLVTGDAGAVSYDGFANGVATYSVAAPGGGWQNGAEVSVTLVAGQVADNSAAANTNAATSQALILAIGGGTTGGVGPNEDLDGDGIANALDDNVDGDAFLNVDDSFAYDADNGMTLADGETKVFDFNTPGTIYEAGMTGFLQGTAGGGTVVEDTGAASVADGFLTVQQNTTGDTGTANDPNDDVQVGVKNGAFMVTGVVENPWFGPNGATLNSFDQLGLHIGVDSSDMIKLVFGQAAGVVEFQMQLGDVGTKLPNGGNEPLPANAKIADFSAAEITLKVQSVSGAQATVAGSVTFLDGSGAPIAGATDVSYGTFNVTGALAAALADPAIGVGVGFTGVNSGGTTGAYAARLDSLTITEGAGGGGPVDPPADPDDAIGILQGLTDVDSGAIYGGGSTGSATLQVMAGNNGVDNSNFGNGSFVLANTGDKQIAAVFIDFRNALYGDSVVDFDGSGGDTAFKKFAINGSNGNQVDGRFDADDADTYFFPGDAPAEDANVSGQGVISPVSGGWRGLLMKFDGGGNGFAPGETVGFSGDMDPNSVAGLPKGGDFNILSGAGGWDVGGVSGAEIIGSAFTVLFDDGSTATGYLGSDDSQAGSVGEAVEGRAEKTASVTVNGAGSSQTGIYGGTEPMIMVSGTPGDVVKVILTKGFDPVTNPTIDALVEGRLLDAQAQFPVNNAGDFQTVNVTIGANGTATVPAGAFDYNTPDSGANIAGYATLPIAVAASVVDGADNPLGPVDRVYLASNGQPVEGGTTTDPGVDGYFEGIAGSGNNFRFKVQIEDPNVENGGQNPGGKWSFVDGADGNGNQAGFQGDGYFLFGSDASTSLNGVISDEVLEYTIEVPEGETGTYTFRLRVSRDGTAASDQQNDIWLSFKKAGTDEAIEDYLAPSTSEAEPVNQGYIKVFGGTNDGTWSNASQYDGLPGNPTTQLVIAEPGLYTVQIAGRSQGYHVDFWELYKGTAPGTNAASSAFVATGPSAPTVASPIADQQIEEGDAFSFTVPAGTFSDLDGDTLSIAINAPVGFAVSGTTITASPGLAQGDYTIEVSATDDDQNTVTDSFVVSVVEEILTTDFQAVVESAQDDIELGSELTSSDLETNLVVQLRFTVADGVANVTNVTSAVLSWEADRTQSGSSTLTFQVEDSLEPEAFAAGKSFVGGQKTAQISGTWQDNAIIENVVDVADQLNALIASQGPLNAGDTINLQVTGTGATRYVVQATAVLDISANAAAESPAASSFASLALLPADDGGAPADPGTVAVAIDSSADDWSENDGGTSEELDFGTSGDAAQTVGLRFDGVDLPEGVDITEAYFEFEASASTSGAADFTIRIEDSTEAVPFSVANGPASRSYAGMTVDWAPDPWTAGETVRSADISELIEAVVEGGGLDALDALAFQITGSGSRAAYSFDSVDGDAPKLVIDFLDDGLV